MAADFSSIKIDLLAVLENPFPEYTEEGVCDLLLQISSEKAFSELEEAISGAPKAELMKARLFNICKKGDGQDRTSFIFGKIHERFGGNAESKYDYQKVMTADSFLNLKTAYENLTIPYIESKKVGNEEDLNYQNTLDLVHEKLHLFVSTLYPRLMEELKRKTVRLDTYAYLDKEIEKVLGDEEFCAQLKTLSPESNGKFFNEFLARLSQAQVEIQILQECHQDFIAYTREFQDDTETDPGSGEQSGSVTPSASSGQDDVAAGQGRGELEDGSEATSPVSGYSEPGTASPSTDLWGSDAGAPDGSASE